MVREYIVKISDEVMENDAELFKNPPMLVRCKDCKHYRYYGLSEETVSECTIDHCEKPDGNWFCADGEPETN